jgi:hypothetical protein
MRPTARPISRPLEAAPEAPRPAARGPGIGKALRKYWRIFRVSLIERMVYRGDFFLRYAPRTKGRALNKPEASPPDGWRARGA